MKGIDQLIFLILLITLYCCNHKNDGHSSANSDIVLEKNDSLRTKSVELHPRRSQNLVNKTDTINFRDQLVKASNDTCKENRECLKWNIKNTEHTYYHDTINPHQFKRNFIKYRFGPFCSNSQITPKDYKLSFLQDYDSSEVKTGKWDGKVFCLNKAVVDKDIQLRIIYSRNEGGHFSDQVKVCTLSKDSTEQYSLDILSEFGKDGYHGIIEGEIINKQLFKRTINEEFGWNTYGKICPLPKRKTMQLYKIGNNGRFELLEEKVETKNFDIYLE